MSFFKSVEKSDKTAVKEVEKLLLEGEEIEDVYSLVTDYAAITNLRLIFFNGEFTSSTKAITSIPFPKISAVHLSKGGFMKFTKEVGVSVGSKDYSLKLVSVENAMELHNKILARVI